MYYDLTITDIIMYNIIVRFFPDNNSARDLKGPARPINRGYEPPPTSIQPDQPKSRDLKT